MRFSVDTNILVYAIAAEDGTKHRFAGDLLARADFADCVLTVQVIGEFLNVIRRKHPWAFERAIAQAERWASTFPTATTDASFALEAARFSRRHKLQFWDSVIWQVCRGAGAEILLSEDMQDGLSLEGLTVINPFLPKNRRLLEALLQPLDV